MTAKQKTEHKRKLARIRKQNQRQRESLQAGKLTSRQAHGSKAPADASISSTAQITTGSPQGPMTSFFQKKEIRKVDPVFYEVLREGIPIIDGAIGRLISFNGTIKPIGENMELVKMLEDFCLNVPVCDMQKGIQAFHQNFANETFEQGFSISEFVSNKKRDDIEELRVADSKRIIFRKNAQNRYEPWYRTGEPVSSNYTLPGSIIEQILTTRYGQTISYNGTEEVRLQPGNKMYFSINNENDDPYGVSVLRSLDFVAQTLVTIQNSMKNQAERFGDPMYHVHLETTSKGTEIETQRKLVETNFNSIVTAKRSGKSGDLVTAGGPNSKVTVTVIGHDGQILAFEIPTRHLLEMIISKFHIPSWLLGIYWSTTERMATLEIEAALADAKIRQSAMLPGLISIFSAFLRLRGRSWKTITTSLDTPGDWGIIFETPNLRDTLAIAQARFLNAQADQMGTVAIASSSTPPVKSEKLNVKCKSGDCNCGSIHDSRFTIHEKELNRPAPWPELDKVETGYEDDLKAKWEDLKQRVMTILKLASKQADKQSEAVKPASCQAVKLDSEAFSFTEEQRAQIIQAMKNWIGTFNLNEADSAIRWYYGQAYSLGLIQAVKLIGKERPILDIIKNQEIFDRLCQDGFSLLKDNATKAIVQQIMPEMQAQMLAGTNPRHVADRLEKLFGDQNSDWERLARSEMSMAAERAKLDEWAEWKVEKVEFTPAPDACPICFSAAGDYPVGACPIPVADTHPRCRCSIRPAESEVKGSSSPELASLQAGKHEDEEIKEAITALSSQVKDMTTALPGMITDIAGRMKTEIIMPEIKFPDIKMPDINVAPPAVNVHNAEQPIHLTVEMKGDKKTSVKTGKAIRNDDGTISIEMIEEDKTDG